MAWLLRTNLAIIGFGSHPWRVGLIPALDFMRAIPLFVVLALAGCTSVTDLTRATCVPGNLPGNVVLKREAYLYMLDNDRDVSLWNSPYRYGSGIVDAAGHMQMHSPPPLRVLPAGTPLTIAKISRETRFDGPVNTIHVKGVVHLEHDQPFYYIWGVDNRINYAPWESETYNPSDFSRTVSCEI